MKTPGGKFALAVVLGLVLAIPLFAVYALIYDREEQSQTAKSSIVQGWGDEQMLAGPYLVIPFEELVETTQVENNRTIKEMVRQTNYLTVAPTALSIDTQLDPEPRRRSIYEAVVYKAKIHAAGRFEMPDLAGAGLKPDMLRMNEAEIRFGISSAKGLGGSQPALLVDGQKTGLIPGSKLRVTDNSGFLSIIGQAPLADGAVTFDLRFDLQGNGRMTLVPSAEDTRWTMHSSWPSPSFIGAFLPVQHKVTKDGFTARWQVGNLALNRPVASIGEPSTASDDGIIVALINPVDLYDQVGRAVKYGLLFIGFTFVTLLMFDIIGGVRVSGVAYFLVGIGLILFFVLLLAFAEVIGFARAYVIASSAILGLITAYAGAVLGNWRRAGVLGAILAALYAILYVLLSLEAYSLLIGSLLMFAALAAVMYFTRRVDWSAMHQSLDATERN